MIPNFEWDVWNSQKSYLKHGITNREAESAYQDPHAKTRTDLKHSLEEERYICIGKSEFGRILVSAFTFRDGNVRIIS